MNGKFNHHHFDSSSLKASFNQYFDIFPLDSLNLESEGFDMGCGSEDGQNLSRRT